MSTQAASHPAAIPAAAPVTKKATLALGIGLAGCVLSALGLFFGNPTAAAAAWFVALMFWLSIAVGMLFLILLHHLFDAGWSTVLRRQLEHGVSAIKWLALLFLPLLLASWFYHRDILWQWMDPHFTLSTGEKVGQDVVYLKKDGYLNIDFFTIRAILYFVIWVVFAEVLRRASFKQDEDGDGKWTQVCRNAAAAGIALVGLAATFAAFDWVKSLEYHWFSTMYGVWFFAACMRGGLSMTLLIAVWLYARGDYKGVLNKNHLWSVGQLILVFTVFWGYICFAQYFLIWNANLPEETFFFVIREHGDWYWVGMILLFGYFFIPFCYLLSYRYKVVQNRALYMTVLILLLSLLDFYFNILPFRQDAAGNPLNLLSQLSWRDLAAEAGIGGICVWSYLRSFASTKLIPIHDPRIVESLTFHE